MPPADHPRRRTIAAVAAVAALTVVAGVAVTTATRPPEHTVTIDIDGVTATHTVRARDVHDVLAAADVTIAAEDLVTPAADTAVDDGAHIEVRHHHTVHAVIDDTERTLPTNAATVAELLDDLGPIADDAKTSVPESDLLRQTDDLDIKTRKSVTITVDGTPQDVTTWTTTVADVLTEAGQDISELDVVDPAVDQPLGTVATITVTKAVTTQDVESIPLAHAEQVVDDPHATQGATRVVQDGRDGAIERTWHVVSRGGSEVRRELVDETRTEPVDRVVAVGSAPPVVTSGDARAIGKSLAAEWGWTGSEWTCLESLWQRESRWSPAAANSSSGAYGIPQALPGSKMASAGEDWKTNPATQIKWGLGYIKGRYTTPCGA